MAPRPGQVNERTITVGAEHTAHHLGNEGVRVFATPMLVNEFEFAAHELALRELEPGLTTVGTRVDVRHLAATPVGMAITFRATLTGVDGGLLTFQVEAHDEVERIGDGTHQRHIVALDRFLAGADAKRSGRLRS